MLNFRDAQHSAVERAKLVREFAEMSEEDQQYELRNADLNQLVNTGGQVFGDTLLDGPELLIYIVLGCTPDDVLTFLDVSRAYINGLGYNTDRKAAELAVQAVMSLTHSNN